jgi:hypothetical protein
MAIDQRTTDPEVFSRLTAVAAEIQVEWEAAQQSTSPTPHVSETTTAARVSTFEASSAALTESAANHGESNQSSAAHDGTVIATPVGVATRPGEQQLGTVPLRGPTPLI